MEPLAYSILFIFVAVGLTALFFNAPGNLILFIGALAFSWFTDFQILTWPWLCVFLGLYLIGEIMDIVLALLGAKAFGASHNGVWGGLIGGIIGGFCGLFAAGIGMIPGVFLGIFAGVFVFEYLEHRQVLKSLKAGTGSVLGALVSLFFKMLLGFTITGLIVWRILIAMDGKI